MAKYIESTAFNNYKFYMTDVSSPTLGLTGLTPTVEISNDAGTFSASTGSATELQSGWYNLNTITAAEMVSGSLAIVATANGANDWRDIIFPEPLDITSIKSDTTAMYTNGINITNSAAQLVWTIPISLFEIDVTTTARSPYYAIAAIVNKYDFGGAGSSLQHYRIDDSTILFSIVTSSDPNADLIVSGDTV